MKYDSAGNRISFTRGGAGRGVKPKLYNTDCSPLSAVFKYDALNRRIEKTTNGITTKYLYDGLDIIQELNQDGTVKANYIRGLNIDEPLARIKSDGTIRHYKTDALGSIIALVDDTGAVKTTYRYDPFGAVTVSGEVSDNPFQYTGRENDNTGLYYYRARYYDAKIGRFISEDPVWLNGGINFYAYVKNSPTNLVDPTGKQSYAGKVGPIIPKLVFCPKAIYKCLIKSGGCGDAIECAEQHRDPAVCFEEKLRLAVVI